jgi:sphingomyelin phosphodiesterase
LQNFWLYDSDDFQPDPNGILAWLIGELQDAENRGQKAWIIGHLSPGKADCLHEPSRYINQILRRYKHTVRTHTRTRTQRFIHMHSAAHVVFFSLFLFP